MFYRPIPQRTVNCRRRPWDSWFDQECRHAKRRVRRLSSRASNTATVDPTAANTTKATIPDAAWDAERRVYCELLRQKR